MGKSFFFRRKKLRVAGAVFLKMIIDTHAHLNDKRLLPQVNDIVRDMEQDNLLAVINVGYDRKSSEISYSLSQEHKRIYAAVGIHPHDSRLKRQEDYDYFAAIASDPKVVAIGETGLDYYYDHSPRDVQKKVFAEHLELANGLKLPVVIHLRDAYKDMFDILKDNKHYLNNGAVLHCYSGSAEMLREYLKFDPIYFSYGGAITFANANKRDIVLSTPIDRLLLETDCPYMTPVPHRGKTNYPKYVNLVASKIQEWLPNTDIANVTTRNAKSLFGKLKV
ncbi:MAG: TatD family hydrolase [Clostridia bacterium]